MHHHSHAFQLICHSILWCFYCSTPDSCFHLFFRFLCSVSLFCVVFFCSWVQSVYKKSALVRGQERAHAPSFFIFLSACTVHRFFYGEHIDGIHRLTKHLFTSPEKSAGIWTQEKILERWGVKLRSGGSAYWCIGPFKALVLDILLPWRQTTPKVLCTLKTIIDL